MVAPMLWMFRVSVLPTGASLDTGTLLSMQWTAAHYWQVLTSGGIGRALLNSVVVGLIVTGGNILFCFMTAYLLSRYRSIYTRGLFASVILILLIPSHVVMIPLYVLTVRAGLYDSYAILILPWLVNPIGIFILKQYIDAIPTAMEQAARVDGAGELRILFQIVMPVARPAIVVLAIQVLFTNWNSFLFPFLLTSSEHLRTLPVALALLQGHQTIAWPQLMAGSSIAVLPVLAAFILLQRHIVAGMTAGAIKQ